MNALGAHRGLATEGAREDAVLMAALLVRPDIMLGLARDAEALGLTLSRNRGRPSSATEPQAAAPGASPRG